VLLASSGVVVNVPEQGAETAILSGLLVVREAKNIKDRFHMPKRSEKNHSARGARMGSVRVARHAGKKHEYQRMVPAP
jgi:hypothetical protein